MKYPYLLVILIIISLSHFTTQTTVTVPVAQTTLAKVTLSVEKLEDVLKYLDTKYQNKYQIYKRVQLTKKYLHELSEALSKYNNVIAGNGNSVNGSKNIIIGNCNNITGSNNWVFVSKFTGKINGDLLIGEWRIQLQKTKYIMFNPKLAISYLDDSRNKKFKTKYGGRTRQVCEWDKWTNPQNQKANKHWEKYSGYGDWKNNIYNSWQKKNLQTQTTTTNQKYPTATNSIGGLIGGILGGWNWTKGR